MKKLRYFFLLVPVFAGCTTSLYAHHWHVGNLPGVYTEFRTLQSAHDTASVSAGDTLYIEPSATSYGNLNWTKRLVIIGNGYFFGPAPQTQANMSTSMINSITIGQNAEGSTIMGCQVNNITFGYNVHHVTVKRNLVNNIDINASSPGDYNYILQNYAGSITAGTFTNNIIENNFVSYIGTSDLSHSTVKNNVITGTLSVYNSNVTDNIIATTDVNIHDSSSALNNICLGSPFGTSNGNQANVNMIDVFLCWTPCNEYQNDARYQLKPGSPASGAGHNGGDCGMFDGDFPYVLSGLPPVPAIYYLNTRVNENSVDVHLKARSHN